MAANLLFEQGLTGPAPLCPQPDRKKNMTSVRPDDLLQPGIDRPYLAGPGPGVRWLTLIVAAVFAFPSARPSDAATPTPTPSATPTCPSVITQSTSQFIVANNSGSCNSGAAGGSIHNDNSYWRAFDVTSLTASHQYNVTSVSFGIQSAAGGFDPTQPVTVRLYRQTTGTFPGGNRVQIGTTTVAVADQTQTILTVPVVATVPIGTTQMIMEVFTPDGHIGRHSFFIGSNGGAQTGTSYLSANDCGFFGPTDLSTIGFATMHLVFNVYGSCGLSTPTPTPPVTPSPTASATATATATATASATSTATATPFVTPTLTPGATASPTSTPTLTPGATSTPTSTPTPGLTVTPSSTPTPTPGVTSTPNFTPTPGVTATPVSTPTPTPGVTSTPTSTPTPGVTPPASTPTPGVTPNPTPGASASPTSTPAPSPAQALNISTRLRVETGNNALIGGFIIAGNATKNIAVRGIGPSLTALGISDALADPTLELRGANGALIVANDNWQDDPAQAAQLTAMGLSFQDSREAGIVASLLPGASYTTILAGKNGGTGVGLVEVYDTNHEADSQLANISTRGFVQTGSNVMIGGFILAGNSNTNVAIRGIGPSLGPLGLSPVLVDPTLELHDGNGTLLVSNDNWQDDPVSASQLSALGLAPADPAESGIHVSLAPGAFTAILAGKNGGTGIGLVEIYNVH
jgi:hypothetical protein